MTLGEQKAEQQLLGFKHCDAGYSLNDLVTSMGLSEDEWENIKDQASLTYLSEKEIAEIDQIMMNE